MEENYKLIIECRNEEKLKKQVKKKEMRYYYYFKLPELVTLYYQFQKQQIYSEEAGQLYTIMSQIHCQIKLCRKFIHKENRTLLELQTLLRNDYTCFIPELSYLKKYLKYVLHSKNIAQNILDAIPYSNLNINTPKTIPDLPTFNKLP